MQYLSAILSIIPALIKIITAIEEAFPQTGAGTEKLALVKDIMAEAYESITEMWPTLESIVALIVSFANKIGAFRTKE